MTRNISFRNLLALTALSALMLLTGCAADAFLLSQGNVPCRQEEMEIVDLEKSIIVGPTSWTVNCRGKQYFCAARHGGDYAATEVDCIQADE